MDNLQLTILDEVQARLENISPENGYTFKLYPQTVVRAKLTPFVNGDLPAVNYISGTDNLIEKQFKTETRSFPLTIDAYAKTRDEPFINVAITLGNQLIAALFRNTAAPLLSDIVDYSLGGLVDTITVESISPMIGEGSKPWCGVLIECNVQYKMKVADFSTTI